jgi:hypothetical protein
MGKLCVRPASVEAQHPVPDDLKPDAADLGRLGARRTVIDRRGILSLQLRSFELPEVAISPYVVKEPLCLLVYHLTFVHLLSHGSPSYTALIDASLTGFFPIGS